REQECVAAQALRNCGLGVGLVRQETWMFLGGPAEVTMEEEVNREPEPDPYAEFQNWPEIAQRAVKIVDAEIEQLNQLKERAVVEQDFEFAAYLRDQADRFRRKRENFVRIWRARVETLAAIRKGGVSPAAELASAILAGDWSALPILADALDDVDDPRS